MLILLKVNFNDLINVRMLVSWDYLFNLKDSQWTNGHYAYLSGKSLKLRSAEINVYILVRIDGY